MTLLFLILLVVGWLGYFFYPFTDANVKWQGKNRTKAFTRHLRALSGKKSEFDSSSSMNSKRLLLDQPRSSYEAGLRRRKIAITLTVISLAAFISVPATGVAGWTMLFIANILLLPLLCVSAHWRHRSAEQEMRSLILNHEPPTGTSAHTNIRISAQQAVIR